ncbi:MAG TPA: hypothetical protein VF808_05880 [Ktedonobacterales bacterium]
MRTVLARVLAVVLALGLGFALFATAGHLFSRVAHASSGPGSTMSFGTATLVNRVILDLPVTITCSIPGDATLQGWQQSSATVSQTVGRTVITNSGWLSTIICTGAPVTYIAQITPNADTPAYHPGPAIASAFYYIPYCEPTSCGAASDGLNNVPITIAD